MLRFDSGLLIFRPFQVVMLPVFAAICLFGASSLAAAGSMKSAVQKAVKTHPSGLAQRANQRAVANELEESRSQFKPQVELFGDIGAEWVHNPNSLSVTDNDRWKATRQVGVVARYTLFDGYERANSLYRNAARLDGALYSLLATSEVVALNAVEAYIDVVRHRQLLSIARRNIRRHQQILGQIRARVRGGKSPASDQFQIEERVFAARAVEVEITKAYQDSVAKYKKAVGWKPGRKMRIPRVKRLPRSVKALVRSSLDNNYELKALRKTVNESEYARESSRSGLAPRVFLEGKASVGADRGGSSGRERDAYVGLRLSWKLYDGGATDARTTALAERVGQAEYLRDVRLREIRETAERAWNAHVNGRKRSSLLLSQTRSNRKIVANYREEYELSKRSLLDVLDAERARFNSEFQHISVLAGYRFSTFRMLATQSKLAAYFGISRRSVAPKPNYERKFVNSSNSSLGRNTGQGIFNINIEPLK